MSTLKGFVTNLSLYNQGKLVGEWIEFPIDEEEFEEVKKRIQIDEMHEEYFFTDYECEDLSNFKPSFIGENSSVDHLNDIGERMNNAEDILLNAAIDIYNDLEEALDAVEGDRIAYWGDDSPISNDDTRIGVNYVNALGSIEELGMETLARYFDYESFGRDLRIGDGFFVTDDGVFSHE